MCCASPTISRRSRSPDPKRPGGEIGRPRLNKAAKDKEYLAIYDRIFAEPEAEAETKKSDPDNPTPTRTAMVAVTIFDLIDALDGAAMLLDNLEGATLISQTTAAHGGKPAKLLRIKVKPTLAGTFGRALYQARRLLPGPSRTQQGGVIGRGNKPIACGKARPRCELGDGVLTAAELRDRLFLGAVHRNGDVAVGGLLPLPKPSAEVEYADVGHGGYAARVERNDAIWMAEVERIVGPLIGRAPALARPAGERDWMVVDSYCRQQLWGAWTGGYYTPGVTLPAPDPAWPLRTALESACAASPSLPLN